ncbi:uncharacterized protein LOC133284900 [Gastrolobium bilobum]|uniref:uncharacterized protein LOC133284900 n=1 Tax=Gastrolobium bilobum TaxID=150636 RepID=UPI002AB12235|nr:uncharacterized protein LOC133284900 [Gastrolobium bilobum]
MAEEGQNIADPEFGSFPNQTFASTLKSNSNHTNYVVEDDDDDWGDFVNHSNQINGGFSKPFEPFGVSPHKHANDNNGIAVLAEKPRGAIPLSIFGEEEEEEPASAHVFSNSDAVKKGSATNGSIGISDLISNLYYQRPPQMNSDKNGSISISNVAAPNPNADGLMNSNASNLNSDTEDEDGWEFKSAEWETGIKTQNIKAEALNHDNGALDVGATLDSSPGISDKAGKWHLGFEFSPSSSSQDHIGPQLGPKSESSENGTGFTLFNQNFGELKNVNSGSGSNQNLEAPKMAGIYPTNIEVLKFDGGAPHGTVEPSLASESHQSDEWDFSFNPSSSSLGKDSHISESYFKTKSKQDDNNKNNASPTNTNVDLDVNLFESKGAVTEIGTKHEKPQISSENRREALPLSIFGDETPDTDEYSVSKDLSPYTPTSPIRNSFNSPVSNISINDLIWNLYSQAEDKTSPNVTPKASENHIHASPEVSGSNLVSGDDDFWDFKDASPGTRFAHESAQNTSFNHTPRVNENGQSSPTVLNSDFINDDDGFEDDSWEFKDANPGTRSQNQASAIDHAPQVNENGLQSSQTVLNSDLIDGDDGFEDDSWEFKDGISGTRSQDQSSAIENRDLPMQLSTELEPIDYREFYSKLKDELCNAVLFHLQNLKKAQCVAALSVEDATAKALQEEIQEFSKILNQDKMSIPHEYLSENYSPRNVHFDELREVLKEPKFQPLESEYKLASRLSMAEKDVKSAMELLKDAGLTLRILKLRSREEQPYYHTIWSKIAFVCSQELKHGAYIWKQAVQKNVHDQILSNPKGVQYIHALGEIYRVAKIIETSAKFYKPWMLSGSLDPTSLFALLKDCYSTWLGSGLEEALFSISNNFELDDISRELIKSIKYIHELDEHALQSHVISGEESTCQLSALPAGFVPGLNLVTWNGKHYFVKLANLWVNLISTDPPNK